MGGKTTLIRNAVIVNEGESFRGSVLFEGETIKKIFRESFLQKAAPASDTVIEADGAFLIPGVIDDQVHFREPGATHKGDIRSESTAAVLGGVTSFMDMPNNTPPVVTLNALEEKYRRAEEVSLANYSFYLGADNTNIEQVKSVDPRSVCGVKVFMGSSTGNMLVSDSSMLERIFRESPTLVATHCEKEEIIRKNLAEASRSLPIPFDRHPFIRSREACIASSREAIRMALKCGTRLHVLHISTEEELKMLEEARKITDKITGEVCVHYMWFDDRDYAALGAMVKCNPAIKETRDRDAIRAAVRDSLVSAVATDHAPHLLNEKQRDYLEAPSGLPTIQHSLQMMLELSEKGAFSIEQVVRMMCHAPADCFGLDERGYIREGYKADLVLLRKKPFKISPENIAYKCGWSPLDGTVFSWSIDSVMTNGAVCVQDGKLTGQRNAQRLSFKR